MFENYLNMPFLCGTLSKISLKKNILHKQLTTLFTSHVFITYTKTHTTLKITHKQLMH